MNIQAIITLILAAVSCCSCHWPTGNGHGLDLNSNQRPHSAPHPNCGAVARQEHHSVRRMRTRHLRGSDISLSPQSASPPTPMPNNSIKTNTTLPFQQPSSKIPYWFPTLENIVTPLFRAVMLILTLFNINISWRVHGQCPTLPCCSLGLIYS